MKKILSLISALLAFALLILQLLFALWLNTFVGLYFKSDKQEVGFIKDSIFFFYTNSSPVAIMFFDKKNLYISKLLKNTQSTKKQLCIEINPAYQPYLKLRLACKPIREDTNTIDKLFCKHPRLTLNMIQSCKINTIKLKNVTKGVQVIYITKNGLEIDHED